MFALCGDDPGEVAVRLEVLAGGAEALRRASQKLHDALRRHLTDFPGQPLPRWLVA